MPTRPSTTAASRTISVSLIAYTISSIHSEEGVVIVRGARACPVRVCINTARPRRY